MLKTPPATVLIKKALKLEKGSAKPHPTRSASSPAPRSRRSPRPSMRDLTGADLDAAVRTIAGTARSMGITVEGV